MVSYCTIGYDRMWNTPTIRTVRRQKRNRTLADSLLHFGTARFDIHLDPVVYNDDTEYHEYLHDPDWTKGETDQLLTMAKTYELRWPVIYDRWCTHFDYKIIPKNRNIEDLQARYYTVAAILMQQRVVKEASQEAQNRQNQTNEALEQHSGERASADALLIESAAAKAMGLSDPKHQPFMKQLGTGSTNKPVFDLNYERARRAHLELLWRRTKEQDDEEDRLRKELKEVETQLRKLKKSGIHVAAAKRQRSATVSTETIKSAFSSPTPMPGTPYLQSARMAPPGTTVNKNLLLQMKEILQEMRIPESPIPSKRVCDLYDSVRRDILSLLVLQKNLLQKEGLLQSKRLVVSKRGGAIKAPDEETLLGIDPKAVARAPDAQTVSVGRPNGPNNKGSKTPRSIASNKSGFAADSRKDIPSVISTTDPDGASKIGASQGKQVKKPGAPKRKRKSADAAKISTTVASATAETSSNSPTQMATETATSKTVGKKRKKTDKATGQS